MDSNGTPSIFIAMPLFEGWEHVGETLQSIVKQSYRNYRVLISVDAADERSRDACLPFLGDSRFHLVVQSERLKWEGNINWLARQLEEEPYFCYWQHDDPCEPAYLDTLLSHAEQHEEASAIYCDMQFFGESDRLVQHPSCRGFALERVLAQVDESNVAVIRCLIRADALRASLPIRLAVTWAISLARSGELHRVPQVLYRRRIRREALTFTMPQRPALDMWDASLEWGLGVLENACPLVQPDEQAILFSLVVDRLMFGRRRRRWRYSFEPVSHALRLKFVRRLIDQARDRLGHEPWPGTPSAMAVCPAELASARALLIEAIESDNFPDDAAITAEYLPPSG